MNKIAAIIFILVCSPATSFAAQESGSRVYVVSGDVFVAQGKNPAHRVINSEPIVSNMRVNTGDNSAAMLKFEDGQVVTMQANSTFRVQEYRYDATQIQKSNIAFSMFKGGMRFVTGLIGQQRKQAFRLLTPNATIGIRGTDFMVAKVGKSIYSQALTGSIGMTNAAGTAVVDAGQFAAVASPGALASVVPASAVPAGTFTELLSIPVDPSAISAPAPEPVVSGTGVGAAAPPAGIPLGMSGGALAGMAGSGSESAQAQTTVSPEVGVQESAEPKKIAVQEEPVADERSGMGLTGKIGTLGYGGEMTFGISDSFSSRIGVNAFFYRYNAKSNLLNYDFKLKLQTVSAIADWYPFSGSFRTSVGLFYNNNKLKFRANPTGGSFSINGVNYSATQVGSFAGTMSFDKTASYAGIGWGNPVAKQKGWGIVSDMGVLFQGKPQFDLVATCTDPLVCAQLSADTEAERIKLKKNLKFFRWWPVVSFGISYQW